MTTREVAFATGYVNTQEFKEIQGPLKAKYRENPESAVIGLDRESLSAMIKWKATKREVRRVRVKAVAASARRVICIDEFEADHGDSSTGRCVYGDSDCALCLMAGSGALLL
jgi:hypothetical protein